MWQVQYHGDESVLVYPYIKNGKIEHGVIKSMPEKIAKWVLHLANTYGETDTKICPRCFVEFEKENVECFGPHGRCLVCGGLRRTECRCQRSTVL